MQVRKLFVIGLGTTGTDICNLLAQRVTDEFGSVERVPWIDYHCFETDAGKGGVMSELRKLFPLTIDEQRYGALLANTTALDQSIHFSKYWDLATLNGINNISSGVGNRRMAGRLAFFYPDNFTQVERVLRPAIDQLRDLSEIDAQRKRGVLPGGRDPDMDFLAEQGQDPNQVAKSVTVAVVGTLCGGTGSGLCVDLGYWLQQRCPYAHVISLFTLPRPDLTSAVFPDAERFKANSYAALRELHHYSQTGEVEYIAKYSTDPQEIHNRHPPYEMILMGWPRTGDRLGPEELNGSLAERLFLMSFPEADPFAAIVNVPGVFQDRNGPADQTQHTFFGTLGLATLEYPAPRIVDYCTYRLLGAAFHDWSDARMSKDKIDAAVLGITSWPLLRSDLLDETENLEQRMIDRCRVARRQLEVNPKSWKTEIEQINMAFTPVSSMPSPGALSPGCVPSELAAAQAAAAGRIVKRVVAALQADLRLLTIGPAGAADFVDAVVADLKKQHEDLAATVADDQDGKKMHGYATRIQDIEADWVASMLFLRKRAAEDLARLVDVPFEDFRQKRLNAAVAQALRSSESNVLGVLETAWTEIERIGRRLHILHQAVKIYRLYCDGLRDSFENPSPITGRSLLDPGQAALEYRQVLLPNGGDDLKFQAAEKTAEQALLLKWKDLVSTVVATPSFYDRAIPQGEPREVGPKILPLDDQTLLKDQARVDFLAIMAHDVIQQWHRTENANAMVTALQNTATNSLAVDLPKAQELLAPTHPARQFIALVPGHDEGREDVRALEHLLHRELPPAPNPSKFRVTILKEYYSLPLEAIPGIVRSPGLNTSLEQAEFTLWLTAARKNEQGWLPISPTEREQLNRCRRWLALGIVLNLIAVRNNELMISNYPRQGIDDVPERALPNNLEWAARRWALLGRDKRERSLGALETLIAGQIATLRSPQRLGEEGFVHGLMSNLATAGPGMERWDRSAAARLLESYCLSDVRLKPIYYRFMGPAAAVREALHYRVGDMIYQTRCMVEGFYCINPDDQGRSLLGATEYEAEQQGWTCQMCNTAYHTIGQTFNPEWLQRANASRYGAEPFGGNGGPNGLGGGAAPPPPTPNPLERGPNPFER